MAKRVSHKLATILHIGTTRVPPKTTVTLGPGDEAFLEKKSVKDMISQELLKVEDSADPQEVPSGSTEADMVAKAQEDEKERQRQLKAAQAAGGAAAATKTTASASTAGSSKS